MYMAVLICPPNGIIRLVFWTYISCTHHIIVTQEPGFPHSLPPYCTLSLSLSFSLILLMYIWEIYYIYYRGICKWAWTLVCCVCALYIHFNIVIMEDFACCLLLSLCLFFPKFQFLFTRNWLQRKRTFEKPQDYMLKKFNECVKKRQGKDCKRWKFGTWKIQAQSTCINHHNLLN